MDVYVHFLTFDLEIRQGVEERALGHQLLVDRVLKAHGAGVGAGHRQIGLHGRVDQQRVGWKTRQETTDVWAQTDTRALRHVTLINTRDSCSLPCDFNIAVETRPTSVNQLKMMKHVT